MRRFRFTDPDFEMDFSAFVDERRETPEEVDSAVRDIIASVRAEGLTALLRLAKEFDGVALDEQSIRVSEAEIEAGAQACPQAVRDAIAFAAERIRSGAADHEEDGAVALASLALKAERQRDRSR